MLDKGTPTRELIEAGGRFALQPPCVAQARLTVAVGAHSAKDMPDKLKRFNVQTFTAQGHDVPLVQGCVGGLICRPLPEPNNQRTYDLFIGQVEAAWADERVFSQGRWHVDTAPNELRTIHHVAGGQFIVAGTAVQGSGMRLSLKAMPCNTPLNCWTKPMV